MLEINNCACTITSVNPRKENHGTEFEPAFDISFQTLVHAECIKGLYSDAFKKAMWNPDGKALNVSGITKIILDSEFEKGTVTIKESTGHETVYNGCKVKSFKLRPREMQMIEVWFQVQHQTDDEEEVVPVFRCLKLDEGVQVTIEAKHPDPTKNKKKKDEAQVDAFPNGEPEEEAEADPFEGSDLEEAPEDTTGNVPEEGFEDFPEDLGGAE